jgi:hypothetical protein
VSGGGAVPPPVSVEVPVISKFRFVVVIPVVVEVLPVVVPGVVIAMVGVVTIMVLEF